jgi:hypothetical protein
MTHGLARAGAMVIATAARATVEFESKSRKFKA